MYDDFYAKANQLMQQGVPFATATVVYAERPTSGKPGDKAIITADGVMLGWIGGSCAQPTVVKEALKALATDESRLIRLSAEPEAQAPRPGLTDLPLTCFSGGTLEILIEPQHPRPRLLVVGSLPVARALMHLGKAMNYHVIAVDLEHTVGDSSAVMNNATADELISSLEGAVEQVQADTYVVVATHGSYDELALEMLLKTNPTYVGLVASPKRAQAVREYLTLQGLSAEELLPLKSPAGLDIQARRGDEIALSIMAEIVQMRRNAERVDPGEAAGRSSMGSVSRKKQDTTQVAENQEESQPAEAIDPVCQMTVEIATAAYRSEYQGQMVYFCSAGCKTKFDANPTAFAEALALDPIKSP